jgi:hypothetical protein
MAGEKQVTVPTATSPIDEALSKLLTGAIAGPTTTTVSPGDTSVLQGAVSGLKGMDNSALLQSIFQQAAGQIQGLMPALSNAIGARTGNNSAISQALQRLLQQTTVSAQDQLVKQQLANLQTQTQAGTAIAQATQGAKRTDGVDQMGSLRNLAILQALSKAGVLEKLGIGGKAGEKAAAPVTSAPAVSGVEQLPGLQPSGAVTAAVPTGSALTQQLPYIPEVSAGGDSFEQAWQAATTEYAQPPAAPAVPQDTFEQDWAAAMNEYAQPAADDWGSFEGFADGGLVGRGGRKSTSEPEETAELRKDSRFDVGFTANTQMDSFAKLVAQELLAGSQTGGASKKPEGYADGGVVRAGGSRRSLNPSVEMFKPQGMSALGGGSAAPFRALSDLGIAGPGGAHQIPGLVNSALPRTPSDLALGGALTNLSSIGAKAAGESGLAGDLSNAGMALNFAANPERAATQLAIRKGTEAALAETLGKKAVPHAGAVIGGYNALTAEDEDDRFAGAARVGMNYIPVVGTALGIVDDLSGGNIARSGGEKLSDAFYFARDSFTDPIGATGSYISNTLDSVANDARFVGDTVSHWGDVAGDVLSNPVGAVSDTVSHWGDVISSFFGWADGGQIKGPGTGVSDSIPAIVDGKQPIAVSNNEYIMPADVVEKVGVEFFDRLKDEFHTPAALQG